MSQYTSLFVRTPHDDMIEVYCGGRSCLLSIELNPILPYEHCVCIDARELEDVQKHMLESQHDSKMRQLQIQHQIDQIQKWSNPIKEKMSAISELEDEYNQVQDDIENCRYYDNLCEFILQLNLPIYGGIECGDLIVDKNGEVVCKWAAVEDQE